MTDTSNTVVSECDLPEAPEKVWKALTVPGLLAKWLPDALDCEVLAAERPRLLCYQWREEREDSSKLDSIVTFELTATEAGGTHLRVVHRAASMQATAKIIPFKRAPRALASTLRLAA